MNVFIELDDVVSTAGVPRCSSEDGFADFMEEEVLLFHIIIEAFLEKCALYFG